MPHTSRPGGPGRGHKRKIGNGPGWGGPAKGAGSPHRLRMAEPISAETQPTGEAKSMGFRKADARSEEMRAILYEIATDREAHGAVRVQAADKLLDRLEGKAVATNVNVNADDLAGMSDAQLAAELARLEREAGEAAARAAQARGEEPPGNVPPVH